MGDPLLSTSRKPDDQQQAYEVYAALGAKRSYAQVAQHLHCSLATVKRMAKRHDWPRRVAEHDADAARRVADRAMQTGVEEQNRNRKIVQMALLKLAKAIAEGKVKMQLGDLDRLMRLEAFLGGTPGQPTVPSGPLTAEQLADMIEEYHLAPIHIQKEANRIYEQRYAPRTQPTVSKSGREETGP